MDSIEVASGIGAEVTSVKGSGMIVLSEGSLSDPLHLRRRDLVLDGAR